MKKTYEKPELRTEPFDAEDVITASSPGTPGGELDTVGGGTGNMETPVDLGGLSSTPGTD